MVLLPLTTFLRCQLHFFQCAYESTLKHHAGSLEIEKQLRCMSDYISSRSNNLIPIQISSTRLQTGENVLFFRVMQCGLHNYILTHFYFLFAQQEVREPMLEGQQTDVTHSVFTTSPTASECITAVPAGRDQERKPNLGMFNMILAAETSIFKCGLCPELQFLG